MKCHFFVGKIVFEHYVTSRTSKMVATLKTTGEVASFLISWESQAREVETMDGLSL
jgi:hypothetical protein